MEPVSPALAGRLLTTGLPGKSLGFVLKNLEALLRVMASSRSEGERDLPAEVSVLPHCHMDAEGHRSDGCEGDRGVTGVRVTGVTGVRVTQE